VVTATAEPSTSRSDLRTIAELLVPAARSWLPGVAGIAQRRWDLMGLVEGSFEAWLIAWPPNGVIELHDHGDSSGAAAIVSGLLEETSVSGGVDHLVTTTTRVFEEGASIGFGTLHVHGIVNPGSSTAVSVHVYSPRLTSMNRYRITDGILRYSGSVRCDLGEALP
jgi:hypothetical protein